MEIAVASCLCGEFGLREDLAQPPDAAQRLVELQARPVAAHHEVVDAERLAVARDLLLHEHRVADDEAVADKLLERRVLAAPDRPQDAYASYLYCSAPRHSSSAVLWFAPT